MENSDKRVNTVELIGVYGDDETHALSAWTSTRREIDEERSKRVGKLLRDLADNGHETPFEKSYLHFLVTTDIATHIHILKHRIGVSLNAESARYKELKEDKFYLPTDWLEDERKELEEHMMLSYKKYHNMINKLVARGVSRKRAKESARFFIPYANQITSDVGFNFRSFIHFQQLRNTEHAQNEVNEVAKKMIGLVKETKKFDLSLEAFGF